MKKGFTLIELLAVLAILVVVLLIAVPFVLDMISKSKEDAFEANAKSLINTINIQTSEDNPYDLATIDETNLTTITDLESDNYSALTVTKVNGEVKIVLIGQNKWDGYVVYGTKNDLTVVEESEFVGFADTTSNANEPELSSTMIPIMYDTTRFAWVKADEDNLIGDYAWYNYTNKKWANAVTVTSGTRSTYQNAALGTVINESDILTYLVWVPRYKYAIPSGTGARAINIIFESNTTPISKGDAIGTNYRSHPGFGFGNKKLNGIWVGKFEPTGTIGSITVKPNLIALRSQSVSSFFTGIRNMEASGNSFGFGASEIDSHIMKNTEWGAVAYLSRSVYGINNEVYKNNSSDYYTGRSGGNVGGSQVLVGADEYISTGFYTYDGKCATTTTLAPGIDANCTAIGNAVSSTALSYNASTTGNIYGIYDMSGGTREYIMGNYNNYSGYTTDHNSGFNGINMFDLTTVSSGINFPDRKYYDLYTSATGTTACGGEICYGQALSETAGWYDDWTAYVSDPYPWSIRSGEFTYTTNAGIFYFTRNCGGDHTYFTTRVVISSEY